MKKFILIAFILFSSYVSIHAQTWQWAIGSGCRHGWMESQYAATDNKGHIYAVAMTSHAWSFTDTIKTHYGPFTAIDSDNLDYLGTILCADTNGVYQWLLSIRHSPTRVLNVAADTSGNAYVLGTAEAGHFSLGGLSFTGTDFLAKINSSGTVLWIKPVPPAGLICVSPPGNIYIAGIFSTTTLTIGTTTLTNAGPYGSYDIVLAQYDPATGDPVWATRYGGTGNDNPEAITLTANNEIYLAGQFTSPSVPSGSDTIASSTSDNYLFVTKFNTSGVPVWGSAIHALLGGQINSIACDPLNNAYITGTYFKGFIFGSDTLPGVYSIPNQYSLLAKYDSSGNPVWARNNPRYESAFSVAIAPQNDVCNIWVSGGMVLHGSVDSLFLERYNSSGALLDSLVYSEGGDDNSTLLIDNRNVLYLEGDYEMGHPFIDTLNVSDSSLETLFLAKMRLNTGCGGEGDPLNNKPILQATDVLLFPNPADDLCTIQCEAGFPAGSYISLSDMSGILLHTYPLWGNKTVIATADLAPGLYVCTIRVNERASVTRKLLIFR